MSFIYYLSELRGVPERAKSELVARAVEEICAGSHDFLGEVVAGSGDYLPCPEAAWFLWIVDAPELVVPEFIQVVAFPSSKEIDDEKAVACVHRFCQTASALENENGSLVGWDAAVVACLVAEEVSRAGEGEPILLAAITLHAPSAVGGTESAVLWRRRSLSAAPVKVLFQRAARQLE